MNIGKTHIGLRTFKTAIAVMCCIILFHITHRGSPMVATLSAVFALREDLSSTMSFGKSRILGNTLGGVSGLLYYVILQYFTHENLAQIFLVPFFVILTIVVSTRMNNQNGIIGGVATLLFISFSIPDSNYFIYAINRVVDTFIGTFIAIFWNYIIKSPLEDKEESIEEKEQQIYDKEQEIKQLQEDINKIKKSSD